MVRVTKKRMMEISKILAEKCNRRLVTVELIDHLGMDLVEMDYERFRWFTYTNDNQLKRIEKEVKKLLQDSAKEL